MQNGAAVACPRCGGPLAAGVAEGLCPCCLLDPNLNSDRAQRNPVDLSPTSGADSATVEHHAAAGDDRRRRYVRKAFHARGGMGEVWLSEDSLIGREVAVKVLRQPTQGAQDRFITEVQTAGRLEHPGIVPVHDLGEDEDGRPFYVMKFVRGRTLKQSILEFHSPTSNATPGDRELHRQRLLKVYLDLCHAVAYAHSREVIHRDIKPDNVMLGDFGETLLLDWGLAKAIGQPDTARAPSGPRTGASGSSSNTAAGTVMGTPTYMAPEMADGRAGEVDRRTDVYLLGATLYEIVTGKPPRQGNSRQELLELARTAQPAAPRRLSPRCPRALEAVVLKAMAPRPQDRYATAMDLAGDVARVIACEPVSAYREPLAARALRWCRRHRRGLARTAAVATVAALALYGGLLLRRANHRRQLAEAHARTLSEQEQARRDVAFLLRLTDEARYFAANTDAVDERAPYYDPKQAADRARDALTLADAWSPSLERLPLPDQRPAVRAALYDTILLTVQSRTPRGADPAQDRHVARDALAMLDRAAALADRPTASYHRLRADCLRALGDESQAAAELQRAAAAAAASRPSAADLFLLGEHHRTTAPDDATAAGRARRDAALQLAVEHYRKALRIEPGHVWARFQLGRCYLAQGRRAEAVEALDACVALRPGTPWGYSASGLALALLRRDAEAKSALDDAIRIDPTFRPALLNRGVWHWIRGSWDQAAADFDAILTLPDGQALPEAAYYRGLLFERLGQHSLALDCFTRITRERPGFRPGHVARARTHLMLGNEAACLSDLASAAGADPLRPPADDHYLLERRARLLREMAADLPAPQKSRAHQLAMDDLEEAHKRGRRSATLFLEYGQLLKTLRRPEEAVGWLDRAVESDSANAAAYVARGFCNHTLERYDAARQDFARAKGLDPHSAQARAMLAYVMALQRAAPEAQAEAARALLEGADDYMAVHNVAGVFAELSQLPGEDQDAHLDFVVALLRRATRLWEQRGRVGTSEADLIRADKAFRIPALDARPDFQDLRDPRPTPD